MPAFVQHAKLRRYRHHRRHHGCAEENGMAAEIFGISCDTLRSYVELEKDSLGGGINGSGGSSDIPERTSMLLLDCRPFLAYNESHIVGAVNVHCPAILRRRSGGRLPLRTLLPNAELRERLLKGLCSPVVLYEDYTIDRNGSIDDSMVIFVARCLQQDAGITSIHILESGFQQFCRSFPHLCKTSLRTVPSSYLVKSPSAYPYPTTNGLSYPPNNNTPSRGSTPRTPKHHPYSYSAFRASSENGSSNSLASCPNHEQEEPVEILPYLYLGSEYHASCQAKLQRLGITALLNVSQTCPNHFEGCFTYKCIPVEDSGSEDISIWFSEAIEFIDGIKASKGKVLVHCHAGISRSATICMAYLMATKRLRMEEAYEYVKSRRRIISPNFNFMGQLLSFESQVFSSGLRCVSAIGGSPRSPLVAIVARTPASGKLSPSGGAQQTVFDFKLPLGYDLPCAALASPSSVGAGQLVSPLCVTPIVSPS